MDWQTLSGGDFSPYAFQKILRDAGLWDEGAVSAGGANRGNGDSGVENLLRQLGEQGYQSSASYNGDPNVAGTTRTLSVRGPDGNIIGSEDASMQGMSFIDKAIEGMVFGGVGAAAGAGFAALGGPGSFLSSPIAQGAIRGGAAGTPSGNTLTGALTGGALGGLSDYFSNGYSGIDYGDGSAFPAGDGSAWTPSIPTMDLPADFTDLSSITNPLDAAINRPFAQLGDMNLGAIGDSVNGGDVAQFITNGNSGYSGADFGQGSAFTPAPSFDPFQPMTLPPNFADVSNITNPLTQAINQPMATLNPSAVLPAGLATLAAGGGMGGAGLGAAAGGGLGASDLLKAGTIAAGAISGAQPTGGGTATQQSRLDPRMEEMLYGQGGLLGSMKDWYAANKSGTNPTIQEGQNMQLGLLRNPNTMQGLQRLQQSGMGLMGGPVAGNPFASNPFKFPG